MLRKLPFLPLDLSRTHAIRLDAIVVCRDHRPREDPQLRTFDPQLEDFFVWRICRNTSVRPFAKMSRLTARDVYPQVDSILDDINFDKGFLSVWQ